MRAIIPVAIAIAVSAGSAQAQQVCKKTPPPFLPDLFPAAVSGLPRSFSSAPGSGCMALYRPADPAARETAVWASVSTEVEPSQTLGEDAVAVKAYLQGQSGYEIITVNDWPVGFAQKSTGDELLTVRGSVRIKISIKNGDHGDASKAMGIAFLQTMLANVPCGS